MWQDNLFEYKVPGDLMNLLLKPTIFHPQVQRNTPKSTFYFYQASNGAHIYLHALNVQMLVHEYGALENCPHILRAKVVEKVRPANGPASYLDKDVSYSPH